MHPYNQGQKSIKRTKKTYFFTQIYRAYTYNMQIQKFFTSTGYVIVKNVLTTFQKKEWNFNNICKSKNKSNAWNRNNGRRNNIIVTDLQEYLVFRPWYVHQHLCGHWFDRTFKIWNTLVFQKSLVLTRNFVLVYFSPSC